MWEYLDELIALIVVIGCLILIGFGIDGEVKSILGMAAVWTFGRGYQIAKEKTKKGG
ncbi:hypothetical protein ES708_34149 [subsurface metagenome]